MSRSLKEEDEEEEKEEEGNQSSRQELCQPRALQEQMQCLQMLQNLPALEDQRALLQAWYLTR